MTGGARIGAGRPADPEALRRDRKSDTMQWVHLSPDDRLVDAPPWPLSRPTIRELELWAEEWRRPQAVMWEANAQEREVALYVRALRIAEMPKAIVAARTLVRQYMDGLGLSLRGLKEQHWIIDHDAEPISVAKSAEIPVASDKERFLRVVKDAG